MRNCRTSLQRTLCASYPLDLYWLALAVSILEKMRRKQSKQVLNPLSLLFWLASPCNLISYAYFAVVANQAGIICGNSPAPPRECTNKDIKIVSVQEIALGKRVFSSSLTKPSYGAIAFDGNLTAHSEAMATGGFQNLTDSIASGAMLLALQKSETNLQYLTAIRNTMFCSGATFKCPLIDAKRNESASLKISSYTYSEHGFLMVSMHF